MTRKAVKPALLRRFVAEEKAGAGTQFAVLLACSLALSWGSAFIIRTMMRPEVHFIVKALTRVRGVLH